VVCLPVLAALPEERLLYELAGVPPEDVVIELAHLLPAYTTLSLLWDIFIHGDTHSSCSYILYSTYNPSMKYEIT
jgi:hypothetical protein